MAADDPLVFCPDPDGNGHILVAWEAQGSDPNYRNDRKGTALPKQPADLMVQSDEHSYIFKVYPVPAYPVQDFEGASLDKCRWVVFPFRSGKPYTGYDFYNVSGCTCPPPDMLRVAGQADGHANDTDNVKF
jgi:hypothetical protein